MKAVVQRVSSASVVIEGTTVSSIGSGLLVLLGIRSGDTQWEADWLADKISNLRIFNDEAGKMNRSLLDIEGEMLIVSQFTLFGDCRKGRRPSYIQAAGHEEAIPLYEYFLSRVRSCGITVGEGVFGAMMDVHLINDGPVTLIVETPTS